MSLKNKTKEKSPKAIMFPLCGQVVQVQMKNAISQTGWLPVMCVILYSFWSSLFLLVVSAPKAQRVQHRPSIVVYSKSQHVITLAKGFFTFRYEETCSSHSGDANFMR